jgi:mono/diheme cytochrome c family protein
MRMRSVLKWFARLLAVMVALAGAVLLTAYGVTLHATTRTIALREVAIPTPMDASTIARGEYLARTRGCRGCHGPDFGGRVVLDAGPVGRFIAPNITLGGVLATYDVARFEHAVRHGVNALGRAVLIMPSQEYAGMADSDVGALFTFLRTVPKADTVQPPTEIGVLGYVLYLIGKFPLLAADDIDHEAASSPKGLPEPESGVKLGRYVAQTCTGCHRENFSGGHINGTPAKYKDAANLTPHPDGLAAWTRGRSIG